MTWMVDIQLLVDILENDPEHGAASAALLDRERLYGELYISPIAYIQLGPLFSGLRELQDRFLSSLGIAVATKETRDTLHVVHEAWCRYVARSRESVSEVPFTKLLIGAEALAHDGLLTRRPESFTLFFSDLKCITPEERQTP